MTGHLLDDPDALSPRARGFLAAHGHRVSRAGPVPLYECHDGDGRLVPGPADGLARLEAFVARYGGLTFCRPPCDGHQHPYEFSPSIESGWNMATTGDWTARVGDNEGWPLTLGWSTGWIGVDTLGPQTWIAVSVVNLVEAAALQQSIHDDTGWREALQGKGPGWGLPDVTVRQFEGRVPEVAEASSPWHRWLVDDEVAVRGWRVTYEEGRPEVVMAWFRTDRGRERIEAVAGSLEE